MSEAIMAYKDEWWNIVSSKAKKPSTSKLAKAKLWNGKNFWWLLEGELFEWTAVGEPNTNGSIMIKGINRSVSKGQPKFEGLVEVWRIKEELIN
mgnify:FL=1